LTTDIEDEIDAIRDAIYEEIKGMTSEERTAYFNAIAEKARNEHNFRVVKSIVADSAEAVHSSTPDK
jgi:bifunctional pyridoxal-dependent enzyme with beta-cystathionase and maltose regulon repressor activities